ATNFHDRRRKVSDHYRCVQQLPVRTGMEIPLIIRQQGGAYFPMGWVVNIQAKWHIGKTCEVSEDRMGVNYRIIRTDHGTGLRMNDRFGDRQVKCVIYFIDDFT